MKLKGTVFEIIIRSINKKGELDNQRLIAGEMASYSF